MALGTPHVTVAADLTRDKKWERPKILFRKVRGRLLAPVPLVVTDGLGAYNAWAGRAPSGTRYVVESFQSWPNNHRIERLNGSLADRLRRRGLHCMNDARDLPLGWAAHHNYVHWHSRLDIPPAEGDGVRVSLEGEAVEEADCPCGAGHISKKLHNTLGGRIMCRRRHIQRGGKCLGH